MFFFLRNWAYGQAFAESLNLTFSFFLNEVEVSWLLQLVIWLLWLCKQVYLYTDERCYCIKVQIVQTVQMWLYICTQVLRGLFTSINNKEAFPNQNPAKLGTLSQQGGGGLTQNLDVPTLILISKTSLNKPKSAKNMKQTKISELIRK